jgi:hypothetical protein
LLWGVEDAVWGTQTSVGTEKLGSRSKARLTDADSARV